MRVIRKAEAGLVLPLIILGVSAARPEPATTPPLVLTTQEDHQRMMDALGIKSLRRGANPNDRNATNAVNYDESKANPYPNLPDPLVLKNGQKVTTPAMWWNQRRPEIMEDFDRNATATGDRQSYRDLPGVADAAGLEEQSTGVGSLSSILGMWTIRSIR